MSVVEGTGTAPVSGATAAPKPKKPNIVELFAQMQAQLVAIQAENKKSVDLLAQAVVKLNEKIEAKPNPDKAEGDWIALLAKLAGGGNPSSLEEAAKSVGGLVKFAEQMDRFRHPFDYEGALAKRLLWRQGIRAGGVPRYMTKEELKRYDKFLDRSLGLEEEEGETEHVAESE